MDNFDDLVARGWADADVDDPQPTVKHFRALLDERPESADAMFAYASALDFAGLEPDAAPEYERAFAAGLSGENLRQGLIQYGSTLRNLNRFDEAVSALRKADAQFPGNASVAAFLPLALTSAGRANEAVANLLTLALDRIDAAELQRYSRALKAYAADIQRDPA